MKRSNHNPNEERRDSLLATQKKGHRWCYVPIPGSKQRRIIDIRAAIAYLSRKIGQPA